MWTLLFESLVCLTLTHFWIKHRLSYWKRNGVCSVKGGYLLGNMKKFWKRHFAELTTDCYRKLQHKDVLGGFYYFLRPMLLIMNPQLIGYVLAKDAAYFPGRGLQCPSRTAQDDPRAQNLMNVEGQRWRELRAKITPTFTNDKLKLMFDSRVVPQVGANFERHAERLSRKGKSIDAGELCAQFTSEVIANCAFGMTTTDGESQAMEKFRKMAKKLAHKGSAGAWIKGCVSAVLSEIIAVLGLRGLPQPRKKALRFFEEIVKERMSNKPQNDMINVQMGRVAETEEEERTEDQGTETSTAGKLTTEEICAQAVSFFTEHGAEAVSATMTWCLYEMAKSASESVQDKLIEEVIGVLQRHGNRVSYEALQDMKYLEQVVLETLRMHPIIPCLQRRTAADYQVPDSTHIIIKDTLVLIPVHAIHYDAQYYASPEEFRPERFSEGEVAQRVPFTFLPAGDGPRVCIGMRFAMLQIKLGLVLLFSKYRLRVSSNKTKEPVKIDPSSQFVVPKKKIWIEMREQE